MYGKLSQVLLLSIVFGLQYLFEHIYPQQRSLNDWKNERTNLGVGMANIAATLVPAWLMVKWISYIQVNNFGLFPLLHLTPVMVVLFTVLVLDCWMYWWHKLNHIIPFFWKFHIFHHRDQKMNSTTALRFHFIELLLSYPGKAIMCLIFGITYKGLILYECLFFCSVVIHHSNIKISEPFDRFYRILFISPNMHRVHHSAIENERDHNYGALFSFWDVLFKSYKKKPAGEIKFGV